MKAFLAAITFIVVTAIGGAFVLDSAQVTSANKFATSGVRLDAGEH